MSMLVNPFVFAGSGGGGGVPGVATDIIFVDSVDHENEAQNKFFVGTNNPPIAGGVSGAHGNVYDLSTTSATIFWSQLDDTLPEDLTSLAGGCRYMFRVDASQQFFLFRDGSSSTQVALNYVAGGSIAIQRSTTQLDITSAGLISLNTWYWFEIGTTIDNTTGSVTAKIYDDSGTLLDTLTFSGDTQNTANNFANHLVLQGAACDGYADNIWLASTDTLYGERLRAEALLPTGNGYLNQWSRGGADSGANWSQLDESPNNDSTDYVRANTTGLVDAYVFQDVSLAGAIHAVQVVATGIRSASGSIKMFVRIGGTNYYSGIKTMLADWTAHCHAWGVNPATTNPWTASEVNGAEFGIESVTVGGSVDVTQVVVEVLAAI